MLCSGALAVVVAVGVKAFSQHAIRGPIKSVLKHVSKGTAQSI